MSTDPEITQIQQRAATAGVELAAVLDKAGVARTTWARWVGPHAKFDPRRSTLRKLHAALDEMAGA